MEIVLSLIIVVIAGILLGIFGAIVGTTMVILVPLLHFLGLPIHTALGSAKISVVSREIIPLFQFNKNKLVNFKIIIPFTVAGAIFSYIGTKVVLSLTENVTSIVIAISMIAVSFIILLNPKIGLKDKKIEYSYKTLLLGISLGALIGFYQGMFGAANIFIIFSFILLFGNTFLKGIANSKLPNLILALVSSLVFIIQGYINWLYAIPLLISTSIGSYFGAKLAIKKGNKFIRALFVIIVIIMAIKLLFF